MSKVDEKVKAGEKDGETEKGPSLFKEALQTIFWALAIAYVVRIFLWEPFNIPSGSMKPTLLVGDYLFVSKYAYGYSRFSLPFSPPLFEGRLLNDKPERGDVIVFKLPRDNSTDYIKRLVGLPGDTVQVIGGILHINGEAVKREKVNLEFDEDEYGFPVRRTQYIETLPNGVQHYIWEDSDTDRYDNTVPYRVPEGHYFMMGDNRDHSQDSRVTSEVGFVPEENLVGRASVIFFSHNEAGNWYELWKWPWMIRFGRIANVVD